MDEIRHSLSGANRFAIGSLLAGRYGHRGLFSLAVLFLVTLKVGWRTAPDANDQETTVADWPWRERMRSVRALRKGAAACFLASKFPSPSTYLSSSRICFSKSSFFFFSLFSFSSKDANFSRTLSIFANQEKSYFDNVHLSSSWLVPGHFFRNPSDMSY